MTFDVVRYDPTKHKNFVLDSFVRSVADSWPWSVCGWGAVRVDMERRIRSHETNKALAVVPGDPDSFLGWAVTKPASNEVVFAYTLSSYRSREGWEPRVATSLVTALGVDLTKPTSVRYWTKTAHVISQRPGYHLSPTKDAT